MIPSSRDGAPSCVVHSALRTIDVTDTTAARTPRWSRRSDTMSAPKRLARIAGVLYLLVGICGGFAEGFVEPKVYVAGDAAATAANVVANSALVRLGVVAHLVDGAFFALTALTLYVLLKHVFKSVARAMLVFVVLVVGMLSLSAVF